MASITCCGTCVPPGPSRKTAGCPLTVWASAGNCERTQVRSRAVDKDEACSAIGIADILIRAQPRVAPGSSFGGFSARMETGRSDAVYAAFGRIGLLALPFVGGVQPYARDSR